MGKLFKDAIEELIDPSLKPAGYKQAKYLVEWPSGQRKPGTSYNR